mmetsp:Transcript_21805/g.33304  ORF Transcript_21805/g.33304 Transcript_21805/m.33304 type:complete len:1027 (-) Transcript_21805:1058-4138(-)|eukprot:CAMPEP_0116997636 /NCGR_PEP_ID=MMETSP0472-20121206/1003_1 /TAXON_ID=693140 ORGANISM="Tiarina fusus, Strain LIS" /NCGR_SAMPLE_ID=MMETSP0472 /ASSEMBLY_ACC=CAM_ASM_000603 /LENGTH=1026 /DNA_ID=CAMNT_0004696577 /DNA_START=358 /DNA_END=3438 /DNA_ORIENTATION=+
MSLLDAAGVVTGDIWCSGAFSFESPLKDLLDSGEYTLEQLLGEDELLQELRGLHPQLIAFFSTEKAVSGLARYATLQQKISTKNATFTEDSAENGDTTQQDQDAVYVRYPYMACEVICCEIKGIIDILVDGFVPSDAGELQSVVSSDDAEESAEVTLKDPRPSTILDLLFSMLYESGPGEIDDYRAGYFDKILSILFRKRPQSLSQYINEGGGRGQEALMRAMFKHLYSHSIMQIVQRLLLPLAPLPPQDEDDESNEMGQLYPDDGGDMDGLGSFRCNWSESPLALQLLLESLIGESADPVIENDESLRLSLYQNASEVLITIIQNSPLTSPTLNILTKDPVLNDLTVAASTVEEGKVFIPHDSKLTCTMNVLESLILQLGGYGSVGTVIYPDEEGEGNEEGQDGERSDADQGDSGKQELATSDTLISHLPGMLTSLCKLLLCPDAENWLSPMQFSKDEPQKILGSSRLRIVRLLESLVLLGDPNVDTLLCESNCLEICLDLFWKFQWCSMLHQSVANLLVHVFEGANARVELQKYFLVKCNLLGRLMNSFWEAGGNRSAAGVESEARLSAAVMAMKNENAEVPSSSVGSEKGSVNSKEDTIPVSDDDVEAALDAKDDEDREDLRAVGADPLEDADAPASSQSFRLGYMGHVIIICQALVHACTNEGEGPSVGDTSASEYRENGELGRYVASQEEDSEGGALQEALERGRAADSVVTDETPMNLLILAQLVDSHPLRNNWQDFVTTTLASETAIQSTPLGGFHGSPGGMDPLHSHRPGLADDGDYSDDDGAAPPLPPRGLLVGGDVIDMDDNDLDVAASMMAGLGMGHTAEGGVVSRSDGDLLASIPRQSGDSSPAGGYLFDDPLGHGRFDDDSDGSSSDEESELSGNTGDSGGALDDGVSAENERGEVPVMNLFAGNLEGFPATPGQSDEQTSNWSDFANFDNAFAGGGCDDAGAENPAEPSKSVFDDVFGEVNANADHAILLEEDVKAETDNGESVPMKVSTVDGEPVEPVADNEETPEETDDS